MSGRWALWLDRAVVGCRCRASEASAGIGVMLVGVGLAGLGLWARREVRRGLSRERIVSPQGEPVLSASAARSLAEVIREQTLETTDGRTYAETDEYLAADGTTTSDAAKAMTDDATGIPVRNPDVDVWLRSTTLQTALMQAYLAFRISDLMLALGGAFVVAGAGITAIARR